jgi:lambda family phage portal protein
MANPFLKAARTLDAPVMQRRAFGGASTSRLYADWWTGNFSPDFEAKGVRPLLRARARQLVNDNSYAAGFITELKNNVVGPTGIRLRAEIKTLQDDLHKKTNDAIEEAWKDWGLPETASLDGHDSFVDIEKLLIGTIAMDGEAFVRRRMYYGNDYGYTLQIIDADQVDDFYNMLPSAGQNEIRSGIEFDADMRPVAYHIWTRHLSDSGQRVRTRVPAAEIKHLFVRYRANQTRGVTWFAPVLTDVKMFAGLTEAELVASRTAAAKMGFIVTKDPMNAASGIDPDDDPETERLTEAAAGTIEELAPGQEFQEWDPQHPSTAFKDFTKVILRGVSRGLGLSYVALTGDLEGVSYSSIRWGMLAERDNWKAIQFWFSTQFHRRVYRDWISMALLTGALAIDSRIASDYRSVSWKPRGWAWVDPLKDIQARVLGIQHGMDSRTQALDEEGVDLEDTFEQLSNEQDMADEYGIDITPVAPPRANSPMGVPSQTDQEEAQGDAPPAGSGSDSNALSEDEQLQVWAAAQIAANDMAIAIRRARRSLKVG